ncbi:MAG: rRNA maturation RNase YbeY [Opitutaceae bacterium]|jgi:probable rRNA maturation factor
MRAVTIHNGHPGLRLDRRAVIALIHALDAHADKFRRGCPPGELSLAFLADADLAHLHSNFLGDPSVTDVITFAGDPAHGLAGEVCVSADAAARQACPKRSRRATALSNPFCDELTLYVVHGWLHLAGYDDTTPPEKRRMRAAEARAMKLIQSAGCQPGFRLRQMPLRPRNFG